jgi:predicted ATPase/DNA-binding SARP family transcriptional activator
MSVRVDLLGPLQLRVGEAAVEVPGARRRALLALLALADGRAVGVDTLVDALWPDDPPGSGPPALLSHVSRVRHHLGDEAHRLRRVGPAYVLELDPPGTDVALARSLAARAAQELDRDPATALDLVRRARALWRGQALEGLEEFPDLVPEVVGLAELHRRLVDDELDARIRTGDVTSCEDAARLRRADPLAERTAMLHVRALALAGRAPEALEEAARFRRLLVQETGLEPGPGLADLQRDVAAGLLRPRPVPARRPLAPPAGPLVGREGELAELHRLLVPEGAGPRARLVTLVGTGGVGKTTLALHAAAAQAGGRAVVVHLAELERPDRVADAVAAAVGLQVPGGIEQLGGTEELADAVAAQDLLLVLDNCEHVLVGVRGLLGAVLARPGAVRVLATSRSPLNVGGEFVVRLQPLPLPRDARDPGQLARQPSVAAFVEHARRRGHRVDLTGEDRDAVVDVVTRLDGLPLAIELAAGRLGSLPLPVMRRRLGDALDVLAAERGVAPDRQRTLRRTVDWSYRLLDGTEQALLLHLAVPPGGTAPEDLEATGAALGLDLPAVLDVLHRLVDASLVVVRTEGARTEGARTDGGRAAVRYVLLETVRAFALDRLAADGATDAHASFVARTRSVAQDLARALHGPDEPVADARLRAELTNLSAVWSHLLATGDVDAAAELLLQLDEAGVWRDLTEVWSWARELARHPGLVGHPLEAAVVGAAAEAAWLAGSLEDTRRLSGRALDLPVADGRRRAWSAAAAVALFDGDPQGARRCWESAAAEAVQPSPHLAGAALGAAYAGDLTGATDLLGRARDAERHRPSPGDAAWADYVAGEVAGLQGRWDEAARHHGRAVTGARACGRNLVEGVATVGLASAWAASGQTAPAAQAYAELLQRWERTGSRTQLWTTARNAAALLAGTPHAATALVLLLGADGAEGAAAVDEAEAGRLAATRALAESALSPDELAQARERAASLAPSALVRLAVEALADMR